MPEIAVQLDDSAVLVTVGGASSGPAGSAEGPQRVGIGERTATLGNQMTTIAAQTFSESLEAIPLLGDAVLAKIESMQRRPRDVEVTMCFKIGAKGTIKLVEASGEAHFQVTFRWDASPDAERPQ